jgi:transcriptional regulator with XRE-family HTH domain
MAESFGARLRHQRERQQTALTSIAEQTKISLSLLEELERDDVSRWPAGIFRRSFIRAYARAIGLEPESVVREFLELHPDPLEVVEEAAPPGAAGESVSQRPPTRLRYLIGSAVGCLLRLDPLQRRGLVTESVTAADPGRGLVKLSITAADPGSVSAVSQPEPDLVAAARLCTELGRVLETHQVAPLLEGAAGILDAVGLIVWVWDPHRTALRPAFAHGYSDEVLARLPRVRRDADNATATAFRSAQTQIVDGSKQSSGALVVPLLTPKGCVGVLALELRHGGEQRGSVCALATIFAAQLVRLVGFASLAEAVNA